MSVEYKVVGPSRNLGATGKAEREVGRDVLTPVLRDRRRSAIVHRLRNLRATLDMRDLPLPEGQDLENIFDRFAETYARRPLRDNAGGTMFNSSFWLFAVTAMLQPSLIVESGTFRGHSSWMMAEASPETRVVTFDVMRDRDRIRHARVEARLGDWASDPEFDALPPDTLLYFDDHISHRRRLEQAVERGGRLALLDDDVPAHALYATGAPPVPTRSMMEDRDLPPGTRCEWERNGKIYAYEFTAEDRAAGKNLIGWSVPMPDLTPVNLYVPQAPMTLVALKSQTA